MSLWTSESYQPSVLSVPARLTLSSHYSFHAHLAQHLFGFPLQIGAWPYLPEGKPTITPLILGVACLIPAERLPHYHHLFDYLTTELSETIFNATPGYSGSNRPVSTENPDAEPASLDAPDLDLELGIGPEEITALCAAATFTCSERSDAMARTVFEWTRGYLKVRESFKDEVYEILMGACLLLSGSLDIQEPATAPAHAGRSLWVTTTQTESHV